MLTHQVFVAFDYGAKKIQTRFNKKELKYLELKLPSMIKHYHKKKNWDILAELLTCMIFLKHTEHTYFKSAYKALLLAQNKNGSWGEYEHMRKKFGEFTEINFHLHTTGVVLETLLEKVNGEWDK